MKRKWIQRLALAVFVMIAIRYHLDVLTYLYHSFSQAPHALTTFTENKLAEAVPSDVFNAIQALPATEKVFSLSENVLKDPEFSQRLQEGLFPVTYAEHARCRYLFPLEKSNDLERVVFKGRVTLVCLP